MRRSPVVSRSIALVLAATLPLPALAAPAVEVTRFHTPETVQQARGAVTVMAAPGTDATSLETRTWLAAVERQLAAAGFGAATAGAADRVAEVRVDRVTIRRDGQRGPVSVGVGGSTGGWGSGVGLGLGLNLGGGSKERIETRLAVTIRDRASGRALWEGRAESSDKAGSKDADAGRASERLARALFKDFPGKSGETIKVK